nr:retrovirus-related Pol polyprotein from transposon TNT 1-94 [Tanacetum cinerariifolium]
MIGRDRFKMADDHVDNEGRKVLKENKKEADCQWKCRAPRSQDTKHKESTRRIMLVETPALTALVSCDGLGGYDWSDQVKEETVKILKSHNGQLTKDIKKLELMVLGYKSGLESVQERLKFFKINKSVYLEDIKLLKVEIQMKDIAITELRRKLDLAQKEKDNIQLTVDKLENASKSLNKLIDCQIVDNCKKGLGYENYNAVLPPYIGNFMPLKPDLSFTGLDEFANKPVIENYDAKTSETKPTDVKKNNDALIIKKWVSDDEEVTQPKIEQKIVKPSIPKIEFIKPKQPDKKARKTIKQGNPQMDLKDKGVIDSGCSRHMTGNMSYLKNYEEINEGYVAFGEMNQFCEMKGILRQYSVVRTPQQNGAAKRRNRILIEATRTMLADSKLPTTFWAEVVNTACYVQNRVLVVKPHNKTSYELFHDRTPALSFMKPFRCPITILNTLDHLVKFDGKANEGLFVGYSLSSKAFRVFNSRKRIWKENLLIRFSENTPNIVGTQSNGFAGTKACDNAGQARKEKEPVKDYILLPLWTVDPPFSQDPKIHLTSQDHEDDDEEADINNMDTTIQVSHVLTTRIHKDHPLDQVFQNKKDERGIVIRNKARLVAQGHTHEERIDYDEVSVPVVRIEAIRIFLAYASFKDFMVYQMDVKRAFLYRKIEEEVYVCQPPRFEDPDFLDKVGKLDKALFIRRHKGNISLVQVYVDDIIFGSTKRELCIAFEKIMYEKFQMSSMRELTFFLGLQVNQNTPMETQKPLLKDEDCKEVDVHMYRSMIGSLMYLTSSRPDIMFVVCACARYQVNLKVLHLHAMKRIFRYLKGQPKFGLWYPKDYPFNLVAYTDSDYAGASLDRKYTTGGCQFLGSRLISWQCKKQTVVANSTSEAEYVGTTYYCQLKVNAVRHNLQLMGEC